MHIDIKGHDVEIDDLDYPMIKNGYTWQFQESEKGCIYFYRWLPRNGSKLKKREYLHRLVIGSAPKGYMIDHIDGNTCNNKKENLRIVTPAENAINRRGYGKSKYKGVSYHNRDKLYRARISANGVTKTLGYRKTPEAAYELYLSACEKWHGEYSRIK